jgi:hypothetical protein
MSVELTLKKATHPRDITARVQAAGSMCTYTSSIQIGPFSYYSHSRQINPSKSTVQIKTKKQHTEKKARSTHATVTQANNEVHRHDSHSSEQTRTNPPNRPTCHLQQPPLQIQLRRSKQGSKQRALHYYTRTHISTRTLPHEHGPNSWIADVFLFSAA